MKNLIYLLLILAACNKENTDEIPSYINIESITLEEDTLNKITDAWIYINDQIQGVYELPTEFPVLNRGNQQIRIRAGIKLNGIASTRIAYPFYSSFIDTINLAIDSIIKMNPIVHYIDSANFFFEDFNEDSIVIDSTINSDVNLIRETEDGNNYAVGKLNDSLMVFEIATHELINLPQAGAPVFLELNYKCNTEFLVGVYVNYTQLVNQKDLLWVNPKENWNKIYINLTPAISEGINATSFKVFIGMVRDFSLTQNEIYLDNIKIVY